MPSVIAQFKGVALDDWLETSFAELVFGKFVVVLFVGVAAVVVIGTVNVFDVIIVIQLVIKIDVDIYSGVLFLYVMVAVIVIIIVIDIVVVMKDLHLIIEIIEIIGHVIYIYVGVTDVGCYI